MLAAPFPFLTEQYPEDSGFPLSFSFVPPVTPPKVYQTIIYSFGSKDIPCTNFTMIFNVNLTLGE